VKKLAYTLLFIVLAVLVLFCIISIALNIQIQFPLYRSYSKSSHYLSWNSELNLKQSGNTCGAHATMALMYLYGKGKKDPYQIYDGFKKLNNGYVLPFEMVKYLKNNGITTKIRIFWLFSNNQKKQWIKHEIENNKPVIIIVGNKNYLHYITVIGYDENTFSVYDSGIPKGINGNNPGTIDINTNELIEKMNSAVFKGIHIEAMISGTE
jgi:hypothetical protein